MDTAQWPQEERIMEHKISNTCSSSATLATPCSNNNNSNNNKPSSTSSLERKVRPQKDEAVNCPRCNSANTKFCYYNNYSLTQPRYFCKTCKRYWTEGGSLRNIPVGGGSRKNKRCSSSSSMSSPPSKRISSHDLVAAAQSHYLSSNPNNNNNDYNKILTHQPQDLNLGFPPTTQHHQHHDFTSLSEFIQLPTMETAPNPKGQLLNSTATATTSADHQQQHRHLSALELLNGLTSSRGLTPFIKMAVPDPNNNNNDDDNDNGVYSSGYPSLLDYKPNLNFSLYGLGNGYGRLQGEVENSGGRLLFPFEDLKQASSITTDGGDHNNITNNNSKDNDVQNRVEHDGDSTTGYWSGMLDAGGSW